MTPRYGHAPIAMRRVKCADNDDEGLAELGDFCWNFNARGERTLVVLIPAAASGNWCYSRWTIGYPNDNGAQWAWDGNEDAPTLSPSLHAVGVWHGWVRHGYLVEA